MTTWYSYYRNFRPLSSKPTGFSGGYNINDFLSPPENGSSKVVDDTISNKLAVISGFMLGRHDNVNEALKSAMYLYRNYLTAQVGGETGDERWQMVLNWQQYNKNELIKKEPQWTALALAMLYIVDGWRILGGRQNARKYRRFARGLRTLKPDNPLKIAFTAVSKIMHNPMNAGDQVLEKVEKMRGENITEPMWGRIYAPRLLRLGVPKLRESDYYNLAEVADNPSLLGKERPEVKVEKM